MTRTPTPALPLLDELDELDELQAKATPGPWAHVDHVGAWGTVPVVVAEGYGLPAECGDMNGTADAALIVAAVNRLPELTAALRAVQALHLPSHSYCVVCDVERDVEAVGNNPTCEHRTSFCRACEIAWPCPTVAAITTALEAS